MFPMLSKLALRNAKRSMRDYAVYLLTVSISFSLMYAFNMVVFSKDIKSLNQMMDSLPIMISFISVIVIAVIEWLVHYMNCFMLEKRSRELGTYMLLGISSRKISRMIMLENSIMGTAAFLAGLLAGTFIYQILTLIIMNLFEVRFSVKADISFPAVLLTLLYVILIYTFSMLRMRKKLKKTKIYDLMYAEKQNEAAIISNKKSHWVFCAASVGLLTAGCIILYVIFHNTSNFSPFLLLAGFLLVIIGLYGAYITLAGFLIKIFLGKNERKFKKDTLFLYRNLSAKLKTMSFTMGTLAMLLTLTLACIQSAMLFNKFFELSALNRCTFDAQVSAEDPAVLTEAADYFKKTRGIKSSLQVPIYQCGQMALYEALDQQSYAVDDYAISYSDYAGLRKMLGYEPVNLTDGYYIIHAYSNIKKIVDAKDSLPYTINGTTLDLQAVYDSPLSQSGNIGIGCIIVLPDHLTDGLPTDQTTLVIETEQETTVEDYDYLTSLYSSDEDFQNRRANNWNTKGKIVSDSRASILIFGFCLYYTGLIFICTAATILAVQQLSEASKHRFRYKILSNLGVSDRKIHKLIFRQLLLYFGIPLLLPIPLSVFIAACVKNILLEMITTAVFWTSVSIGLGLFLLIYLLYFTATYVGCRQNTF